MAKRLTTVLLLLLGLLAGMGVVGAQDSPALLSAYYGLDDSLPLGANLVVCRGAGGQDGMPVIFSQVVNPDTLQPADFAIITQSGAI